LTYPATLLLHVLPHDEDFMARLIERPTVIAAAGNKPKRIEEFVGRVNTRTEQVSIAHMQSAPGWEEAGQTPEFDEFTLVLAGMLRVETKAAVLEVHAGQAVHVPAGEWVRYSTPEPAGADYIAVCVPAFSPHTVHRDA
jgi:ethanolamine utilization protein EutQ